MISWSTAGKGEDGSTNVYRDENLTMRDVRSMAMVVGTGMGTAVVIVLTEADAGEDELMVQTRSAVPSFPALSFAVTRIIRVSELSGSTSRVKVPDIARSFATESHVPPPSFETPISTPETPLLSAALQMT